MQIRKFFRRKLLVGGLFVASSFSAVGAQAAAPKVTPKTYIAKYKQLSMKLSDETGVPASIILGVAMLESGMGTSKNVQLLKNHFGIVGKNKLAKRGISYRSKYREYASDEASFHHFVKIVQKRAWFQQLKGTDEHLPWLTHLNKSGYSSAGLTWVKRVSSIIKKYNLEALDQPIDVAIH
ncbi:flagellum-specific peptidoglycan hydrolase FlgJ [Chitinophaga skermanii]|uniref:Flagellum-specific peptidoglycan hydrolase FlgJ n=1 Tax=Chitinophaga skermanii TaxID=331697 RepID=A0A327R189_9BACT|nr:glucosaminidase domain-containing protein [Chitinophaga skermanii]RAJ10646.1 flagellum-specific peptidoglycan hydrolase FlgJ [Chitinophaga skermanii]